MSSLEEIRQKIQKEMERSTGQISSGFAEIASELKAAKMPAKLQQKFDRLFALCLQSNRSLAGEASRLMEQCRKLESLTHQLKEEKRRLEMLYTSGIQFTSETEMKSLLGKAIDTVIKALEAEEGFIVLVDKEEQVDTIVSRNMNPDKRPDAREMSSSVIHQTISNCEPTRFSEINDAAQEARKTSILRLGIKSALCVPLVSKSGVLGAVYLDRRDTENSFTEGDLVFLLGFARQIVQGLEISQEISLLESKLLREAQIDFEELRKEFDCPGIIGSSKKLFEVLLMASKIAPTNTSVIIEGENGTGKELLADAIHGNSRRAGGPFAAINCSAIPADLLESELFGYEAGAFTGATKPKPGKLEAANGGTLFLDEIGELQQSLQAKLLRVLQTMEIERLGSVHPVKIDVRVLAATNRDLTEMVKRGEFREDLYYRLKVIKLILPPLRERREDIAELVDMFLKKHGGEKSDLQISGEALEILESYSWPGNIRELENVILRAIVLAKGPVIIPADLPPELLDTDISVSRINPGKTLTEAETEFRKRFIQRTLKRTSSKTEAAKQLGINRTHFYRMLSQLGIKD